MQLTHPNGPNPTQPASKLVGCVGLGCEICFYSGLGWFWVIKFTNPLNPTHLYLIYI